MKKFWALLVAVVAFALVRGAQDSTASLEHYQLQIVAPELKQTNPFTLVSATDFLRGLEPVNSDGTINAVIEVPAGTTAKWEVNKKDGSLTWDFEEGKPRLVRYLAYPVNYGMIPRTVLSKRLGGDGDPLDVLVLGPLVPRGSVVSVKVVGLLKLVDRGDRDDKLIAVIPRTILGHLADLEQLQKEFPGVAEILQIWFSNYRGLGRTKFEGFGNRREATELLNATIKAFAAGE